MIKSCVTIALVPEIKSGPWIFWDDLEESMVKAHELKFDAIELFTPSAAFIEVEVLKKFLVKYHLELAAVGTGAGKVIHGFTLTDPDPSIRKKAIEFISTMIDFGGEFGTPAIIGSMQGNVLKGSNRKETLYWLSEALEILGDRAKQKGTFLIYEPLNRYETNLLNTLQEGAEFLETLQTKNVKLLADLFHMNIEEIDLAESIRNVNNHIGHIHFADSNRLPIGHGHTNMKPISDAIKAIGYQGYISAEAFPYPTPEEAAEKTINSFKLFFS